ncbi:MAG: mannose-1-phosphate guanylyltransferase/mannose-6-phosphate isomerase [Gammaproteobacteria bacterium]|nr:mannose-1-phosphate guanylyltransferase/mannose-6-phosphate isomerase [Gammaproteobacteria bacterium]
MLIPVIMCGGTGTRLWPLSRHLFPKQFHALTGGLSLFQQTVQRCIGCPDTGRVLALTGYDYRFMAAEQLDAVGVGDRTIILEPAVRNTAPAIALAALQIVETDPAAVMLVVPSDHYIRDEGAFRAAIGTAVESANAGGLVTLGITPSHPATGYGYIKAQSSPGKRLAGDRYAVERFVEKPALEQASEFLAQGGYYWNSGMFLFQAGVYLSELQSLSPEILDACRKAWARGAVDHGFRTIDACYGESPSVSIDYAVMERTDKAVVVPYSGDWSDIGSWSSLAETGIERDDGGNTVVGDVYLHDVTGSFIFASDRLVAGVGLEDTVVVETRDAVLVAARGRDQEVKQMVELLKADDAPQASHHTRVYRPWGSYEDLDSGPGFHVKRLTIKPGASISLQRHFHRSEHWVVVQGEATVVRDDETYVLGKNESTDIPVQAVHKLTNAGVEELVIVEVQTGDYLAEDDIERLKDDYGRS